MTEAAQRTSMGLREVRRTRKREVGFKDPTAAEALRRAEAEREKLEGIETILKAHEERRLRRIRSWCRRQARHRRRQSATR